MILKLKLGKILKLRMKFQSGTSMDAWPHQFPPGNILFSEEAVEVFSKAATEQEANTTMIPGSLTLIT